MSAPTHQLSDPSGETTQPKRRAVAHMLELPTRGDIVAVRWLVYGLGTYLVLGAVFVGTLLQGRESVGEALAELIGFGEPWNLTVAVLVLGGLTLMGVASWSVWTDIRAMRPEEEDVDWVQRHGRKGVMLVFAPVEKREELYRKIEQESDSAVRVSAEALVQTTVETLVDDRVRRTNAALTSGETAGFSAEEMRILGEQRTARWGSFARYSSSLLLLLAVLGTFAGVKTALPDLIQAVGSGVASTQYSIVGPLQRIADAFGGNALALVGAIALGLMAQGIASGRRHFLQRLELVSTEYIYRGSGLHATSPIESAVVALRDTAEGIRESNGQLIGIEAGLERLGSDFRKAVDALEERFAEVISRHESDRYDQTTQAMHVLQSRVADLTEAVSANARIYGGLVDRVNDRAGESRDAIEQLRKANESLARALNDIIQGGEKSRTTLTELDKAAAVLSQGTSQVRTQLQDLTKAIGDAQPTFRQLDGSLNSALTRLETTEQRAIDSWATAGQQVSAALDGLVSQMNRPSGPPGPSTASPDGLALLRRIAESVETPRKSVLPLVSIALLALNVIMVGALLWVFIRPR